MDRTEPDSVGFKDIVNTCLIAIFLVGVLAAML